MDAADLYRLPPEDFTAARDAAAKQAKAGGDADAAKALKALRKPSVAAWLVNGLVDREPALLEQLLDLGPALAQAQSGGKGDALRELGAQRRALVGAVVDRAVALADRPVTTAVRDEVAATLEAGLSDPASADAVRSGRLVRALSYAGFGGVDLDGAVAEHARRPEAAPKTKKAAARDAAARDSARQVAGAEAAALEAAGALDDAVRACERLTAQAEAAEQDADQARAAVEQARAALAQAEQASVVHTERAQSARQRSDDAVRAVQAAQEREQQARRALDRLRREQD